MFNMFTMNSKQREEELKQNQNKVLGMVAQQDHHNTHPLFKSVRDDKEIADMDIVLHQEGQGTSRTPGRSKRKRATPDDGDLPGPKKMLIARGVVGELPLHMAALYGKEDFAIKLITEHQNHGISTAEAFGDGPFLGENTLHIAIAQRSHKLVDALLEKPTADEQRDLLLGQATGFFFDRAPQEETGMKAADFFPSQTPEVETPVGHYFGEYPLSFAVSLGHVDMIDKLLKDKERAEELELLQKADRNGNTPLHLCVYHDQILTLDHLFRYHGDAVLPCLSLRNLDCPAPHLKEQFDKFLAAQGSNTVGLTPLMLAVRLGRNQMVETLEVKQRTLLWRFGHTVCELVPLDDLDPIREENDTGDAKSAFTHEFKWSLLNDIDTHERSELLKDATIGWQLVEKKWESFAEEIFSRRAFTSFFMLFIYFAGSILDSSRTSALSDIKCALEHLAHMVAQLLGLSNGGLGLASCAMSTQLWDAFTWVLLGISHVGVIGFTAKKLYTELNECLTAPEYWQVRGARFLENFISVLACSFVLLAHGWHVIIEWFEWDSWLWSVLTLHSASAVVAWSYLFFFLLGYKQTGPFVVMLWEMLKKDIVGYCFVFGVFFFGFMQALNVLSSEKGNVTDLALHLLNAAIGSTDGLEAMSKKDEQTGVEPVMVPRLAIFLIALYILFATLMMFNSNASTIRTLAHHMLMNRRRTRARNVG